MGWAVVLTVVLNVVLRDFPDLGDRVARGLTDLATPKVEDGSENERRVRVVVPWNAMILVCVILTIVINVVLRLT